LRVIAIFVVGSFLLPHPVYAMALSVCHKPVFYHNDWTDLAVFGTEAPLCWSYTVL